MRLALTSNRTRREIAEDLDIGLSALTRWLGQERDLRELSEAPVDRHAESERLRHKNSALKQERSILNTGRGLLPEGGKSVKYALIDAEKATYPISRMCRVMGVSQSGFFAWHERPACRRPPG